VKKLLMVLISSLMVWAIAWTPAALAADTANGAKLFEVHCAGCHANGGNIVRRNKTLKLRALEKNQVSSLDAIATLVANGKANMSAYKDRLTPTEIEAVSAYVWQQAQQGWR
jgi:cytochrome c6